MLNTVVQYYSPYCFLMNNLNVKYVIGNFQFIMQKMTSYIGKVKFSLFNFWNSLVIQNVNM